MICHMINAYKASIRHNRYVYVSNNEAVGPVIGNSKSLAEKGYSQMLLYLC